MKASKIGHFDENQIQDAEVVYVRRGNHIITDDDKLFKNVTITDNSVNIIKPLEGIVIIIIITIISSLSSLSSLLLSLLLLLYHSLLLSLF